MLPFLVAFDGLVQGRPLPGQVLDEWTDDAQEFIHTKLPHLIVVAVIAFILIRLLRIVTARMIRVAEQHAAGPGRIGQVRTLSGVIRTTGLAIIAVITGLQFLDAVGVNLGPAACFRGSRRHRHRPGRPEHRQRHAQRRPHPH